MDVRTILRSIGLLKTLVKVIFEKRHYSLLALQRHERYPDKLVKQSRAGEKSHELDKNDIDTSDVVHYSSGDDELHANFILKGFTK